MKRRVRLIVSLLLVFVMLFGNCITTTIEVQAAKRPTKLILNYTKKNMSVGDKVILKVKTVKPAGASKSVIWISSNKKVATINNKGSVTAKKAGTITITAKSKMTKKVVAKCKIRVYSATKSLKLTCKDSYVLKVGEKQKLTAKVTNPKKGAAPIRWSSKNAKIAKVDAKGNVTAVKKGKTTIVAKSGTKSVKVNIQVNKKNTSTSMNQEYPEPTTIKVAVTEMAYGIDMWKEVAAAFRMETGNKVELIIDRNLEDVISDSIAKGEYPDVIQLSTRRHAGLTEQFIDDKKITNITDVLSMKVPGEKKIVSDKIAGGFTETPLTNPYGDGKTYLAPMFYSPTGLCYNVKLLEENRWTVPRTWDEMWELGERAKEKGIALFTYPTTGYLDGLLFPLMYSAGGPEFFYKATTYTEGIWETPEAQECFDILEKLAVYTHDTTPALANDEHFRENQQKVLNNQAIFMPNGSWIIGEMSDAPRADGFKWGVTAYPSVTKGGDSYSLAWFEQIWIPSQSKKKEVAKLFIAFLYSDVAAEIFAKGYAIQPIIGIAEQLRDWYDKEFYTIYDDGAKVAAGNFAEHEDIFGVTVRYVFLDPFNDLVKGSLTKARWISDIIEANDKMRENLK